MNTVQIGSKTFTGPAGWADITPRHFRQLLNWRIGLDSDPAGRWVLLELWYGIGHKYWHKLSDDNRVSLISLLDFLDTRPERWMLPKLRIGKRTYIGPGDGLDFLTFGEFMYAQAARDRYRSDGQPEDLAELMASLYRPRAFFFQPSGEGYRKLFDIREHPEQIKRVSIVPVEIQQGVLMNFEGCLDRFPTQFPHLFKQSGQGDGGGSWLDVGLSLARQTSALGTFAQLERSNLFLVLSTLDAIMKENEELKAKLEK
ncbi:hypothetical protein [Spirosoma oryzicola]|uniref:hypothetical protein n=1 Tax=Spirosoma oryzicola TaxID=2898794 RepID=UPI001E5613A4|nr:hypothetical protein [Spirosoma oryzicola]UHG93434.1 hypothetical protein LQ777_11130 [Spirosoma oryzicola]